MKKKSYYIHFYDPEQPLCYRLYYLEYPADRVFLPEGVYQITRKDAEQLARNERMRRKRNRPGAGLSDDAVFPGWIPDARILCPIDPDFYLAQWIWLKNEP